VATAMIAVATDIGDKINRDCAAMAPIWSSLRRKTLSDVEVGGVNLNPRATERSSMKPTSRKFAAPSGHNNIVGFSPMLPVTVKIGSGPDAKEVTLVGTYFNTPLHFGKQDFTTGVRITHPWWKVSCGDGRLARPEPVEDSPAACGWPNDDSQNILIGERLAAKLGKKPATHSMSQAANSPSSASSPPARPKTIRSSRP